MELDRIVRGALALKQNAQSDARTRAFAVRFGLIEGGGDSQGRVSVMALEDVPPGYSYRGNFGSPEAAQAYVDDAGIPTEYVIILANGDLYVLDGS